MRQIRSFNLWQVILFQAFLAGLVGGCLPKAASSPEGGSILRLATTTSTYDSGLLDAILPDFEAKHGVEVEIIAVGTGQALALGEAGDADVVLVHAEALEIAFVSAGFGTERFPVMLNDFVIVGPADDPAGVRTAASGAGALLAIAGAGAAFASRGDESGTHARELALWSAAGLAPDPETGWYFSLGQGMGETLHFAEQKDAYTLADRGTYFALQQELPHLRLLFGGDSPGENPDPEMRNLYSVIPVNQERYPEIRADLALAFVKWIRSPEIQERIGEFGVERFGFPLFFPNAEGDAEATAP